VVICLELGEDCLHMLQLMPLHLETPSSLVGMVELCAKNLQIMRNDFTDYARTFCQLCALFANYAQIMRNDFKDICAHFLPIMRTFFGFVLHMNVPSKITIFEFRYTGV